MNREEIADAASEEEDKARDYRSEPKHEQDEIAVTRIDPRGTEVATGIMAGAINRPLSAINRTLVEH